MTSSKDTDVAVIGAGPYGLSVSAHLNARGISNVTFGTPMDTWRHHMPVGMYLKSEGFASNLSDPRGRHTLEEFCAATGREYGRQGAPISAEIFSAYGCWFQEQMVPELDRRSVALLRSAPGDGFELTLSDGDSLSARRVVVATGVQGHAFVPPELGDLPPDILVHAYDHVDVSHYPESGTVVIGAGQSALEAAVLVAEQGGSVKLVARTERIAWLAKPGGPDRPLVQRLREPESGLGEGFGQWAYSNLVPLFHAAPEGWRLKKAFSVLGPAGGWWLRPRFESQVEILLGRRLVGAEAKDGVARLRLQGANGVEEIEAGQIVAGTGYRLSLDRIDFIDPTLKAGIAPVAGGPRLDRSFESSVPGLFFVGYPAAPCFGPVMRFVYGADFTAKRVGRRLAS